MGTYEFLQRDNSLLVEEAEIESLQAKETVALNRGYLQNLTNKKNLEIYLIKEGMFDLNSKLYNANLIIEDTEIPQTYFREVKRK